MCGVATLTPLDMAASKLLANSDRWRDDAVMSRDLIDLAMMQPDRALFDGPLAKATAAYGKSVAVDLDKAIETLRARPQRLDRCMEALQMTTRAEGAAVEADQGAEGPGRLNPGALPTAPLDPLPVAGLSRLRAAGGIALPGHRAVPGARRRAACDQGHAQAQARGPLHPLPAVFVHRLQLATKLPRFEPDGLGRRTIGCRCAVRRVSGWVLAETGSAVPSGSPAPPAGRRGRRIRWC